MTKQKKTELIDYFNLVWIKNSHFWEKILKMEAIFPPKHPSKPYFGDLNWTQKFWKRSYFFVKSSRKDSRKDPYRDHNN